MKKDEFVVPYVLGSSATGTFLAAGELSHHRPAAAGVFICLGILLAIATTGILFKWIGVAVLSRLLRRTWF